MKSIKSLLTLILSGISAVTIILSGSFFIWRIVKSSATLRVKRLQ